MSILIEDPIQAANYRMKYEFRGNKFFTTLEAKKSAENKD
jgi:hypothetical protein